MSEDAIDMTAGEIGVGWKVYYPGEWCTVSRIRDFGSRVVFEYTDDTLDTFDRKRQLICQIPEEG